MVTTELGAGEHLRTVPGENVARTRIDLSLPDADSYSRDTFDRIRKNLGADYVVLGSFFDNGKKSGGQVRVDLRLQDAAGGETMASESEVGTEASLLDLVSRAGATLRDRLGAGEITTAESASVRSAALSNPEMVRIYSEALAKLRFKNYIAASDLLQKAVVIEPDFAPGHSALADAWSDLGYDKRAASEAKKAFDLSAKLPREQRLAIEAGYRKATKDWKKSVEIYRTLFTFFPDNLDYGLRLCLAQDSAGSGKDALITVEAFEKDTDTG
jgi:hypothetical protein